MRGSGPGGWEELAPRGAHAAEPGSDNARVEPIASSGLGATFRATAASDLNALLRDGRVLAAEVLSAEGDGALLLAIGRQTIPAESELRLDPGQRFLVRVEQGPEGTLLELLGGTAGPEDSLLTALRAGVGDGRPVGALLGELARALRGALAGEAPHAWRALAEALAASLMVPEGDGAGLRNLLAGLGLSHESALSALLAGRAGRATLEALRGDLKALLLAAEAGFDDGRPDVGGLRGAIARALAGLEAEQLLNLARERAGEPSLLSLPFPDPSLEGEWATARLLVPARRERDDGRAEEDGPARVTVGLELSNLGALRADLTLTPERLSLRLLVTRGDVARRVVEGAQSLRRALADGRRAVELHVRVGTAAEVQAGLRPLDIRYLREHHLMSVDG